MGLWTGRKIIGPRRIAEISSLLLLLTATQALGQDHDPHRHHRTPQEQKKETLSGLKIPDIELFDQDGKKVRFYSDLIRGKVVAINTIFTTCTTICPIMGVHFAKLQSEELLGERVGKDLHLISISVDPATDTPARLKHWSGKLGARPGWTLLTGGKSRVDTLLKALNLFTPDKESHTPLVLIGNDAAGYWTRTQGLIPPEEIAKEIAKAVDFSARQPSPAAKYFTDVRLLNQDGKNLRFFDDLLRGKVVVIHPFFTSCRDSCPVMVETLAKIQRWLGDRLGKEVHLISMSVDPEVDTPEKLKAYADQVGAKPGWDFLTGEGIKTALYKLGFHTDIRDNHKSMFLIGNEPTGLWKRVLFTAPLADLERAIESTINDRE